MTTNGSAATVSAVYRFVLPSSTTAEDLAILLAPADGGSNETRKHAVGSDDTGKTVSGAARYLSYVSVLVQTLAILASAILLT